MAAVQYEPKALIFLFWAPTAALQIAHAHATSLITIQLGNLTDSNVKQMV